jgi:flavorubredoxin
MISYVSMWGNTESIIHRVVETLASEGVEVALHNLTIADLGDIAKEGEKRLLDWK